MFSNPDLLKFIFGRLTLDSIPYHEPILIVTFIALLFLMIKGVKYPNGRVTPWYTNPGFIVGIPAVPFIMPFLLGVVLLRRAGEEQS